MITKIEERYYKMDVDLYRELENLRAFKQRVLKFVEQIEADEKQCQACQLKKKE